MTFQCLGADSFFGDELHRGAEEVMEQPPLPSIEAVEQINDARIREPLIAEPLPDMSPVLLLHMGVIVFVVGPASGELNRVPSAGEMSQEVVIEKLRAVITIEAQQGKRKGLFNMVDLLKDPCLPFAPYGSLLAPPGSDIHAVNGIGEHTSWGGTAVGYGIGLEESGADLIPLSGLNGDVLSEKRSWLGGSPPSFPVVNTHRFQHSVNSGRRDPEQGIGSIRAGRTELLAISGQPQGKDSFEPL